MSALTFMTRHLTRAVISSARVAWQLPPDQTREPLGHLTFDDGPHPEYTPRILDALAACNVRATFFVLGRKAARRPALIRRMIQDGHRVGNHTWNHRSARLVGCRKFMESLQRTRQTLEDLTGESCPLVRPPFGDLTPSVVLALLKSDWKTLMWSRDPQDYQMTKPEQLVAWFQTQPPTANDIVLLHDTKKVTALAMDRCLRNRLPGEAADDRLTAPTLRPEVSTYSQEVSCAR